MSVWWTYSLQDFLLFAPRTYYRLFELYNLQMWPLHLLWLALGSVAYLLYWRRSPVAGQAITAVLALAWLWVACAYHLQHYATINWAAYYYAIAFIIQALLLFWLGVCKNSFAPVSGKPLQHAIGSVLFIFAVACFPLSGLLLQRNLLQAECFGMAPDPTILATLGMLLLLQGRARRWMLPIPVLWSATSSTTLWVMNSPEFWLLPLAALLTAGVGKYGRPHAAKHNN